MDMVSPPTRKDHLEIPLGKAELGRQEVQQLPRLLLDPGEHRRVRGKRRPEHVVRVEVEDQVRAGPALRAHGRRGRIVVVGRREERVRRGHGPEIVHELVPRPEPDVPAHARGVAAREEEKAPLALRQRARRGQLGRGVVGAEPLPEELDRGRTHHLIR